MKATKEIKQVKYYKSPDAVCYYKVIVYDDVNHNNDYDMVDYYCWIDDEWLHCFATAEEGVFFNDCKRITDAEVALITGVL